MFVSHLHLLSLLCLHGNVNVDSQLLVLVAVEQADCVLRLKFKVVNNISNYPIKSYINVILVNLLIVSSHQQLGLEQDLQDLDQDVHLDLGGLRQSLDHPTVSFIEGEQDRHLKGGRLGQESYHDED